MACNSILNILKGNCDGNNVGGIYEVYVIDQDSIISTTTSVSAHTITAISASTDFSIFEFKRNVGNFTTEDSKDLLVGSTVIKSTITLQFNRREGSKSRALNVLGEGQRYLAMIVKSADGTFTYFKDMQLMSVNEDSGTARADGSKYTVVFTGEDETTPYFVAPNVIPALIS
jgi:hypothetical protein